MTRYSYNGWPVIEPGTEDRLTEVVRVGGRAFRFARGDVARVFEAFLTRFVAEVEPLTGGELDDWSYNVRLTRGSTTRMSCHSSATACDLNSLAHPRGVRGTFGAVKERRVRRILDDFPVLRWGEDFKTAPADSMHFEVDATPAEVAAFTRTLTPHAPPVGEDPDMQLSDHVDYGKGNAAIVGAPTLTVEAALAMASAKALSADRKADAVLGRIVGVEAAQAQAQEYLTSVAAGVAALTDAVTAVAAAVAALTPGPPPVPPGI